MSELSDAILEASDVGCCVTRMGVCHCEAHINETARAIGARLQVILRGPDAAKNLLALVDELENAR